MMKTFVSKCREFDTAAIETAAIITVESPKIWHKSCVLHFLAGFILLSNRTPSQKNIFPKCAWLNFCLLLRIPNE